MQDIHSIGAGGRLFLGGGGGDRRLRPSNHQALKCPRCDSLNTKFCYYNNYNLSQPRHFCKNCRRYWTKGGVLRNVPVGGGVRKAKRAKNKPSSDLAASPSTPNEQQEHERNSNANANSNSSCSESSSLTAITNANKATTTTIEAVSVQSVTSGSNNDVILPDSKLPNPNFEAGVPLIEQGPDRGIFLEMASFTNMITSSSDQLQLQFGFGNMMPHHHHQQPEVDLVLPNLKPMAGSTFVDQIHTAAIELPRTTGNGGFGSLDWQANTDQGLFDIPNSVDHSYWNQSHWTDHDQDQDQDQPPIYFP